MKDTFTTVQIWVEFGIALLCFVLGARIWFFLFQALQQWRELPYPVLWSIGTTVLFNLIHFTWGFFHTDENIWDLPSGGSTFSMRYNEYLLFGVRIIAIVLIGTSIHLQKAIELTKTENEKTE